MSVPPETNAKHVAVLPIHGWWVALWAKGKSVRIWQALSGLALITVCGSAVAESPITPYTEYHKRIRTAESVSPLTSELFGESVNLSSGSTEFVVTDIDVPGNDSLPVRLQRRLSIQSFKNRTAPPLRSPGLLWRQRPTTDS